jgi:hypothetical protein
MGARHVLVALGIIFLLLAAAIGALVAWRWYFATRIWPKEVQMTVLGAENVPAESFYKRNFSRSFGEGSFEWWYRVDAGHAAIRELCQKPPQDDLATASRVTIESPAAAQTELSCYFEHSLDVEEEGVEGVTRGVHYGEGVLLLYELWP